MSYVDRAIEEGLRYKRASEHLADEADEKLAAIKTDLEKLQRKQEKENEEFHELFKQAIEESKSTAEKKAEQEWAGDRQKFGNLDEDEPEASKPVRRAARIDDSTRNFVSSHDDEPEETEPYRRPQRWDDEDDSEPEEVSEPVAKTGRHSLDDEAEESEGESAGSSRSNDWGGSTRRIGNYGDDEDD